MSAVASLSWEEIHDWMDKFHEEVIDGWKVIRGRTFISCHLQSWERGEVWIVMSPRDLGDNVAERLNYLQRIAENGGDVNETLEAILPIDRFERIVRGKDVILEEDWLWSDEL